MRSLRIIFSLVSFKNLRTRPISRSTIRLFRQKKCITNTIISEITIFSNDKSQTNRVLRYNKMRGFRRRGVLQRGSLESHDGVPVCSDGATKRRLSTAAPSSFDASGANSTSDRRGRGCHAEVVIAIRRRLTDNPSLDVAAAPK